MRGEVRCTVQAGVAAPGPARKPSLLRSSSWKLNSFISSDLSTCGRFVEPRGIREGISGFNSRIPV
jgi:hypothetical protein